MADKLKLTKRRAGVALPLFSLNEDGNWGTGEIGDIYPLVDWLASFGQTILQLLPFNEMAPGVNSPYAALSIFAIDPVYITLDKSLAKELKPQIEKFRKGPIPYQKIRALKLKCLEEQFKSFLKNIPDRFREFEKINEWWLNDYALFRLLKEKNNWFSWKLWAPAFRDREKKALDGLALAEGDRLLFIKYVQWIAWEQWKELKEYSEGKGVMIKGDIPFAPSDESDIAWTHREIIDPNFTLGAPPDAFSETGQEWGLPVYHIGNMEKRDFDYWRARARWADQIFNYYRIDHVVGCYRMYAFPEHRGDKPRFIPEHENEQLAIGEKILSIIKEESKRSYPMAEDLGVIPDVVRGSLTRMRIPGYKVMRWEKYWKSPEKDYIDPADYPEYSIATTGTHDSETLAEWWDTLGREEKEELIEMICVEDDSDELRFSNQINMGILRILYNAGSLFVILPMQDLFGWRDRVNTPGTFNKNNWSYRLPAPIKTLGMENNVKKRVEKIKGFIEESGRI